MSAYPSRDFLLYFSLLDEFILVDMMSGTSVTAHISLLYASMVAHMRDPYSEFHSFMVCRDRLLQSLPIIAPWVELRIR